MEQKTKRIVDTIATVIPSGLVLLSGTMKFIGGERVVQGFTALGVVQYLPFLGMAEICFPCSSSPEDHEDGLHPPLVLLCRSNGNRAFPRHAALVANNYRGGRLDRRVHQGEVDLPVFREVRPRLIRTF